MHPFKAAQRAAAIAVAAVLLLFCFSIGLALVNYGPMVEAAAGADQKWTDVWELSIRRAAIADLWSKAPEAPAPVALLRAAAEDARHKAGRSDVPPLRPSEMTEFIASQVRLEEAFAVAGGLKTFTGERTGRQTALAASFARTGKRFHHACHAYNAAAAQYNARIRAFPASLLTRPLRFVPRPPIIRGTPSPEPGADRGNPPISPSPMVGTP